MARYEGKEAIRDSVLQVAKLCAAAAYKAPQLTAKLEIKTEIITGEDQEPIIEFFKEVSPISPVMGFDYETLKHFRENGDPLVILLIGADLTSCELSWNCGACGFETCAEFNKFARANKGRGSLWSGPSCSWKTMDFGAACDYACAAAAQYRFDCRAMATVGAAASGVGYLPDCSAHIGIPIGPAGDFVYYSRQQNMKKFSVESHRENLLRSAPTNWLSFPGGTKPSLKHQDNWWAEPVYPTFEKASPEEMQFVEETMAKVNSVSEKYAPKIAEWYSDKK